jgi:phosphate starvation-inducible PhoH-like protein
MATELAETPKKSKKTSETASLVFDNNALIPMLLGENDLFLKSIEEQLKVVVVARGNMLAIDGEKAAVAKARSVIEVLYEKLEHGQDLTSGDVDAALRMAKDQAEGGAHPGGVHDLSVKTLKKIIRPYTNMQASYIQALYEKDLVFALGPAGTGKTYVAVAMAVHAFINRKVDRIILSRPAVEAGEKLGFLPGDLKDKIDPYLRPLYDALFDMMPAEKVARHVESGEIEVAPLAFMRGRTLSNAYIILDEAQNSTATQMKMFLTRLGENSRMVVTGDLSQIDLPRDVKSGLMDATRKLKNIDAINITHFGERDVVRHKLAVQIVHAYEEWDKQKKKIQQGAVKEE